MRIFWYAVVLQAGVAAAGNSLHAALDEICAFHSKDCIALSRTLDSLTEIATRLQSEPENLKYRQIRLLNKTFWERIGSVNGGISFMSSLGFDLLGQDAGEGPRFVTRPGAPDEADLRQALDLLSARRVQLGGTEEQATDQKDEEGAAKIPAASRSGFDPFATAFSRKSRTHVQERAEQGLAHLSESQARRQQRFSKLEERNITILLPPAKLQPPREALILSGDSVETEEGEDEDGEEEGAELELVAQLWRERMAHDEVERFETTAVKKLRLLRSTKVYPYVVLRVRLPGGVFLQGRFNLEEGLETVYQVVEESLSIEAGDDELEVCRKFELFMAPPTRVFARDGTTLKESNVVAPACVLHLRWESEDPEAESWAHKLEERLSSAAGGSVHPRLPYASRYDVPEAISSKRTQDPRHIQEDTEDIEPASTSNQ